MKKRLIKKLTKYGEYIIIPQVFIGGDWNNIWNTNGTNNGKFTYQKGMTFGYYFNTFQENLVEECIDNAKKNIDWWIKGFEKQQTIIPNEEIIELP